GGNGAGKSTLLRMLAGLEAPSSGHALVFGQDTRRLAARYRRRIGLMAHQSFLYPNLTARENLEFYAELYSLGDPRASVLATAHAIPEIDGVEFAVFEISRGRLMQHTHKEEVRRGGRIRSLLGR